MFSAWHDALVLAKYTKTAPTYLSFSSRNFPQWLGECPVNKNKLWFTASLVVSYNGAPKMYM